MTSVDVDLDHLAEVVRLLHCKVSLFPPFPYCSLWKEVTMCRPHLEVGSYVCSTFLTVHYLHKVSGILLRGGFVFSPSFIYLLSHLYQYGLMGIYFIFGVAIPYSFILMSLWHSHTNVGFCFCFLFVFEYFLTFWHHKMLQTYLFPTPVLGSAISPRSPGDGYFLYKVITHLT